MEVEGRRGGIYGRKHSEEFEIMKTHAKKGAEMIHSGQTSGIGAFCPQ